MSVVDQIRERMITGEPMTARQVKALFKVHPANLRHAVLQLEAMGYTVDVQADEEERKRRGGRAPASKIWTVVGDHPDPLEADQRLNAYLEAQRIRDRQQAAERAKGNGVRSKKSQRPPAAKATVPDVIPKDEEREPKSSSGLVYLHQKLPGGKKHSTPVPPFGSEVLVKLLNLEADGTVQIGIKQGNVTWLCNVVGVSETP